MTNPFTAFPFSASGSNQTDRTLPVRLAETSNVKDFGALGDGTGALLNTRYGSLAAAQAVYPFVTNIATQSIDWAAAMAALYNGSVFLTATASNQTASFTGVISGSNLTTSSVTGTIATGSTNLVIGTNVQAFIVSQTSGTPGGAGVYVLDRTPAPVSEAMVSVSCVLTFASVPASVAFLMAAFDITVPGVLDGTAVNSTTATTVTMNFVNGVVNIGDLVQFYFQPRGTIYFPPGSYVVNQPIDFALGIISPVFLGELGASTISGNFADYVFSRGEAVSSSAFSTGVVLDKLTIVNANASGGGIRAGGIQGGAIRDCTVTANRGINLFNADAPAPAYAGSFDITIENCNVDPGFNVSGSKGIMSSGNGPVTNCRFIGHEIGFSCAGGEANQNVIGCYFEGCGTGIKPGFGPDGGRDFSGLTISGCWFKNNSIAVDNEASGLIRLVGIRIEGTNGQAPGATNPQYGIKDGDFVGANPSGMANSLIAGVTIVGQYDKACVSLLSAQNPLNTIYAGVQCTNTGSGVEWSFDFIGPNLHFQTFIACDGVGLPHIYTVADLPAPVEVGDSYNVNDGTNSLAWGATITDTGTHATHYKVRYNGSNYTVMGQ